MKSYYALSEADLAEYFMRTKGAAYQPARATALVANVEIWLSAS